MFKSIATVSVGGTLGAKVRAIADAGFNGLELVENDLLTYDDGNARDVGRMIRDSGLVCTAFQPFRDFEGLPEAMRTHLFDRVERKFDLMQELGTDLLIVTSNASPAALGDRPRIVADLRELAERAKARGLRIGYEALAWGRFVFDHREAWSLVRDADHESLGLVLSSFHSLARKVPIDSLPKIDPSKIFLVHLADAPALDMDFAAKSRHFRYLPGQGDLDLELYVSALWARGYKGAWSIEVCNDRFRSSAATMTAVDGIRSFRHLEDQVARRLLRAKGSGLPPRVRCEGIEFVEFAANDAEVEPLSRLFAALGFSLTGMHRSKRVTRWSQHGINLLINNEPESFARAYANDHGASVCAIGVTVGDVAAARQRARSLHIDSLQQPIGPGEARIPAIRGVGNSLIHFIPSGQQQDVWARDFVAADEPLRADAGLLRVDYLTQTMQYESMLSWLLFYLSLFDVTKLPQVEIDDPFGLVYSQALESADRRFRMVLNSSQGTETLSSRFLHGFMGAGVQHIALLSEDIFATARALKKLGSAVLPIPANYYEDLAARFELTPELIEQLAAHNILYDRDADGEYFQLYLRAFAKRFFFEIVERRGYVSLGTQNAAIRLAAQSRYRVS